MNLASSWLVKFQPRPNATHRLFCFPYAGGSTAIYRAWAQALPEHIELCAVQLPGRGTRIKERPFTHFKPLILALASGIVYEFDRPFLFFGHSMGASIAFELAAYLRRKKQPLPLAIFASGSIAPHRESHIPPLGQLSDEAFTQAVNEQFGIISDVLRQNPEALKLFLPILRADLQACETYKPSTTDPLATAIYALSGSEDPIVTYDDADAWADYTTTHFEHHRFAGNHFFFEAHETAVWQLIQQAIQQPS